MIKLSAEVHIHDWINHGEHFATLPKFNLTPGSDMGMEGIVEECECGARRFSVPRSKAVAEC